MGKKGFKKTKLESHSKKTEPHKGIKFLFGYSFFLLVAYLIYLFAGLLKPTTVLYNKNLFVIDLMMFIVLGLVVYGFNERKKWVWSLSMAWFSIAVVYSIIYVYYTQLSREIFLFSSFIIILLHGFVVWYIFIKKKYFTNIHYVDHFKTKDQVFIYTFICFWILILSISGTATLMVYKETTNMTDKIVYELEEKNIIGDAAATNLYCQAKQNKERDVCYLVLTTLSKKNYCENIESDLYKFTCQQALT